MRFALFALAFMVAATPAFAQKPGDAAGIPDTVVGYHESDARMNGAIAQARALLPLFWAEFRSTDAPGAFTIKAGLRTDDGGVEHIWVGDLRFEGERLIGNLVNEPYYMAGLHEGSRVEVAMEEISDWTINTPDGVYGGFTTRVMLEDMPPAQAEQYRVGLRMTPHPAPSWWSQ
ncbi:MAG: DUF2314 domain-containing protein [Hyphomonadaceae bacterium]